MTVARFFRAAQVSGPGIPLAAGELPLSDPGPRQVRVRVLASGVCGADIGLARSTDHSVEYPIVPGHEIAGTVDAVGAGVDWLTGGDRVAVGWFGGSCGHCRFCRRGDVVHCSQRRVPGRDYPGGWAQYVTVPADAVVAIPDGLDFTSAAPFGCAGVTVFNAIRHANIPAGGRVAIFGLGGLGHLAVQFSAALGYETVAIARGDQRRPDALRLGAHHYLDATAGDPGAGLAELGGADLIVYAAANTEPAAGLLHGLATHGRLTLVGVDASRLDLPVAALVTRGLTVTGHLTGGPEDVAAAMRFALLNGIAPVTETAPLGAAANVVHRLRAGHVRYRTVLLPWAESQ